MEWIEHFYTIQGIQKYQEPVDEGVDPRSPKDGWHNGEGLKWKIVNSLLSDGVGLVKPSLSDGTEKPRPVSDVSQ